MAARSSEKRRLAVADALHSAAIHLLRRVREEDEEAGVGPARLSALSVLVFAGPQRLTDLARAEQVRPPTMTKVVTGLEGAGLARRDRRSRRRPRRARRGDRARPPAARRGPPPAGRAARPRADDAAPRGTRRAGPRRGGDGARRRPGLTGRGSNTARPLLRKFRAEDRWESSSRTCGWARGSWCDGPGSPPPRSCRWRSASASTRRSSPSSTPCLFKSSPVADPARLVEISWKAGFPRPRPVCSRANWCVACAG